MLLYLVAIAAVLPARLHRRRSGRKGFEQLQIMPMLIVTPLTFLGGAFYSIDMLAEPWRTITLFNPVVYLINGFRWTFFSVRRRVGVVERGGNDRNHRRLHDRHLLGLQNGLST